MNLNKRVKDTLKKYGEGAAAHFGVSEGTLKGYIRKGKYPLKFINQILAEGEPMIAGQDAPEVVSGVPEQYRQTTPSMPTADVVNSIVNPNQGSIPVRMEQTFATAARVEQIVKYLQTTVDFYIRQFAGRIENVERACAALSAAYLRASGAPSLARPAEGVPVDQIYTTNPNVGVQPFGGNALISGVAPTKEQVDAQANITTIGGVPIPNAQVAHPAVQDPNALPFGFGWNAPRPRK